MIMSGGKGKMFYLWQTGYRSHGYKTVGRNKGKRVRRIQNLEMIKIKKNYLIEQRKVS